MGKEKDCRILEIRNGSGQLLFSLLLIEKEEIYSESSKKEKASKEKAEIEKREEAKKEIVPGDNEPLMTDAQKRYLFRILAEQGFDGETAHEHLKKVFGVDSLKKVSRLEASREIERRLEELKGGGYNG